MKYQLQLTVSGNKEDLTSFVQLCGVIQHLCISGASRIIPVDVDGDGSADLRFELNGVPLRLPYRPNTDHSVLEPISIGE